MAIVKRTYRSGGKENPLRNYSIEFRDHAGIIHRVTAFSDKTASLELDRQLKRLVSFRIAGAAPDAELSRFIESCPAVIRKKLGKWDIIALERASAGMSLKEHAEEWRHALTAKGNSREYIKETISKIERLSEACGWRHLSNITTTGFNTWRMAAKDKGMSPTTMNMYLTALRNFCNWLVREKRLAENSVAYIPKLNAATDRRRERRAFTVEELGRILAAAEKGKKRFGMTGPVRALLYRTATETGLRWSELRSLTKSSFNFDSIPATVTIKAANAKNGLDDTLPLRPELAADLKAHMVLFLPTARAFSGMWVDNGAKMLRLDLEAAGVPYKDEYGRYGDFHAFRHTYGTLGAMAGIPLVTMQKLMRHSDPKLTANLYTHVLVNDKAAELAKLPTIAAATTLEFQIATDVG